MNSDPHSTRPDNLSKRVLLEGSEREDLVVQALKECQAEIDAGQAINREAILASYPQIREELSACLDGLDLMRQSAKSVEDDFLNLEQHNSIAPLATLGDFRIVREIARGGMGVVYEAEQLSIGRSVALKVLPFAAMLDKRQIARFQNEARAAATLEHPHIVPVYFVGNERGVYYYAMRLIDGQNLADVLKDLRDATTGDGKLPSIASQLSQAGTEDTLDPEADDVAKVETTPAFAANGSTVITTSSGSLGKVYYRSVAQLVKQAAEALEFAHSHGIIHRDIKPANILLDEVGDAWVTDFGLARIETDCGMTATGDLLGTLRYMSPEQVSAKRASVDHRSDIYSLGATLYELLALRPPFESEDRATLLREIAVGEPKRLSKLEPAIPYDLETIVLKALHKNPIDRYATAGDLANDLGRFLAYEPVRARRTPVTQRLRMWGRRHPALTASCVIVTIVILAATSIIGLLSANHERAVRTQQEQATKKIAKALQDRSDALERARKNLEIAEEQHERAEKAIQDTNEARMRAEANAENLRKQLYVRDMRRAFDDWNQGRLDEVSALLNAQVPVDKQTDYRGFEWHILRSLTWRSPSVELRGHHGPVYDLAAFADETRLASVGADATVRVWNLDTEKEERVVSTVNSAPLSTDAFPWKKNDLRALAVSPDAKTLVTGNRVATLWDLESGSLIRKLTSFPTRIFGVAFSPDGQMIAAHSSDEGIRVTDISGRLIKAEATGAGAYRLCFSPDGSHLVAPFKRRDGDVRQQGIRCWTIGDWGRPVDYALTTTPRGCAFNSNGRFLACGESNGGAFVLQLDSGNVILNLPKQRSQPNDIAFSPDDQMLALAYNDGTVVFSQLPKQWQGIQEKQSLTPMSLQVHDGAANAIQFFAPDRIATCGDDAIIRLTDVSHNLATQHLEEARIYNRCRFCPDQEELLVATYRGMRRYHAKSLKLIDEVELWLPTEGDSRGRRVMSMETNRDGNLVAIGSSDGGVVIYDLIESRERNRFEQIDVRVSAVTDIAISPDGKWLANGSRDHTVRIRSTNDGTVVRRMNTKGWGVNVEFSADGSLLAYSDSDGELAIVETGSWREVARSTAKSGFRDNALRFSSDGRQLFTGHKDSVIRIWNTSGLTVAGELKGHMESVLALDVHSDGKTLVSVGADRTVRLWDLSTLSQIGILDEFDRTTWDCHFSNDGKSLAISACQGKDGACHVWNLTSFE